MMLLSTLSSCLSSRMKVCKNCIGQLKDTNLDNLNGIYMNEDNAYKSRKKDEVTQYNNYAKSQNLPLITAQYISSYNLWKLLTNIDTDSEIIMAKNIQVQIEVINSKQILVSLLNNDSLIKSKILSGEIRNGFFAIKPLITRKGFPIIYCITEKKRVYINIDDSSNIKAHYRYKSSGQFLFVAQDGYDAEDFIFKKIN